MDVSLSGSRNNHPISGLKKLLIILLSVNIGLSLLIIPAFLIGKTSMLLAQEDLDKALTNEQKLLSANYLAASNNAYLVTNQRQFVPELPTIHRSLQDVDRLLHDMEPIIARLGQLQTNNMHGLNLTQTPGITK